MPPLLRSSSHHQQQVSALDRDRSADVTAPGLSEHEKYLFDVNGYIVVKRALSFAQLNDCRERLKARLQTKRRFGSDRTSLSKHGQATEQAWSAPSLSAPHTPHTFTYPGCRCRFCRGVLVMASFH